MLTFNLKKEWFEKIKNREKTHEYREYKSYWRKRLEYTTDSYKREMKFKKGDTICFKCGYPKTDETDKIIYAKVIDWTFQNGLRTDLKVANLVYDIEFEVIGNNEIKKGGVKVENKTELLEKLFKKFNIPKGVFISEIVGDDSNGLPIYGDAKFFTTYKDYDNSINYYHSSIDDEESFEDWKEYPHLGTSKQLKLLKEISNQLNGSLSIKGNYLTYSTTNGIGGTATLVNETLSANLAQLLTTQYIFDELTDKSTIKKILEECN